MNLYQQLKDRWHPVFIMSQLMITLVQTCCQPDVELWNTETTFSSSDKLQQTRTWTGGWVHVHVPVLSLSVGRFLSNSFIFEEHSSSQVCRCQYESTGGVAPLMVNRSCRSDSDGFYSHFLIFCSITANNQTSATERASTPQPFSLHQLRRIWTDVHLISMQTNKKTVLHVWFKL